MCFPSRQSSIAADSLESYKNMIESTTDDLEAHLESINENLEKIVSKNTSGSSTDAAELQLMEEERLSTQKCLEICQQLSNHIDQLQHSPKTGKDSAESDETCSVPERVTNEGLQECKESLLNTAEKLENHLKILMERIMTKSKTVTNSEEVIEDMRRLQEEWETTRQCMHICSKAGARLDENSSTIENYATGDAVQFMVSTNGTVIHGKNRGLGWRTRQVGGHLSEASLQQLSKDMTEINFGRLNPWSSSPARGSHYVHEEAQEERPVSEFKERYGPGFKLTTERSARNV